MYNRKKIIIVGDPLEDIYTTIEDGKTISSVTIPGGASNVYKNVQSILRNKSNSSTIEFVPELTFTSKYLYKILRINNQPDIHLYPTQNKENYYSDCSHLVQRQLNLSLATASFDSILILSDYNKGVLNTFCPKHPETKYIKLAIVDSKYRSLHYDFFEYAYMYIWRCTGEEYCSSFAKNFDYTIWTNADKPIKLLDKHQNIVHVFSFTPSLCVDACGAGDTFTAAIGSYLYTKENHDLQSIKDAISFAIICSQEVITIPKTAITTKKL